jgi:nucleotide-binding universal stress UspA family protein
MQAKLIIAATDFSANADQAVERALALAERRGVGLLIVHVIPPVLNSSPLMAKAGLKEAESAINDLTGRLCKLSREELASRYLAQTSYAKAEGLCLEGKAVAEILRLIAERDANLLVIGATGETRLAGSFFGSTASKLIRKAPCSVLVVRAPEQGD